MNKFRFAIHALAIVVFTVAFASITQAQATRTWVSGVGDDANPCSRTAPCKTFAGAISKTANGGEIDALDPGGFGALTITKSITIDGGGGQVASVLVAGTNGFVISAQPTDVVILRNLRFQGLLGNGSNPGGAGIDGIKFIAGKALHVENCFITGFNQHGIEVAVGADGVRIFVSDTTVENCNGDGFNASTTVGQVWADIRNSSFIKCNVGLRAKSNSRVFVDRGNFANCVSHGVFADGTGGASVADIANSAIFNNGGDGIRAEVNNAVGRISNCDIHNNQGIGAHVVVGTGEIDTFTNNRIFNNGTDGCANCLGKTPA